MEENSRKGLTNVQNARSNNWESRDLKHFKISLALQDALATILVTCGENDSRSSYDTPRSVQLAITGRLALSTW
jgi:hypothetical protein